MWLQVRLTGQAQKAWKCLSEESKQYYYTAKAALSNRFEPSHQRELYLVEYQERQKKAGETWGEVADNLQILADKAFPHLSKQAKNHLTLDRFLSLIDNPKVTFAASQQRPGSLEDAVTRTLGTETYLSLSPSTVIADHDSTCYLKCRHTRDDQQSSREQYTSQIEYTDDMLNLLSKRVDKLNNTISQLTI